YEEFESVLHHKIIQFLREDDSFHDDIFWFILTDRIVDNPIVMYLHENFDHVFLLEKTEEERELNALRDLCVAEKLMAYNQVKRRIVFLNKDSTFSRLLELRLNWNECIQLNLQNLNEEIIKYSRAGQ
ncbi:hypothetical protein EBS02_09125, partial [bacterium]|nr:hypothetical protein [bacterium]